MAVHAVVGDFHRHLDRLPTDGRRLVAFLGGTIGNLDPAQRRRFLFDLDCVMDAEDRLLLGTDLVKDRARLVAAYDDAAGVTAEFNRNVLSRAQPRAGRRLRPRPGSSTWPGGTRRTSGSRCGCGPPSDQAVHLADLDLDVAFAAGEEMLTEISAKFTPEALEAELVECGFVVDAAWTSEGGEFQLTLCHPYC